MWTYGGLQKETFTNWIGMGLIGAKFSGAKKPKVKFSVI